MNGLNLSAIFVLLIFMGCNSDKNEGEWIELFNGKDLSNWKANESPESFKVVDGVIVANGQRSHLLYVGDGKTPVDFKNFELSLDVMTHHLANSGVYFHTAHQKEGWLDQGYEVQINATHKGADDYKEVKKGGSLYGIRNLYRAYIPDSVWYNLNIRVEGKRIQIRVNDQLVVDYTEPAQPARQQSKKVLSSGTFALQGHDPESTVFFKNVRVKVLPDTSGIAESPAPVSDIAPKILKYQADHIAFIDLAIDTDSSFNIDSAMQGFYKTGVNLGLVMDTRNLEKGKENEMLLNHVNKYIKYPVFVGMFRSNLQPLEGIPATTLSQFDYVAGDISTFKNPKGEMVDIIRGQNIGNKETFMNDYVNAIAAAMDQGGLDVWASATLLPESLRGSYDALWTKARMEKVIDAAKRNNVAIEVNNEKRLPGMEFLKLAKEKGCTFAIGGLYKQNQMNEPDYFYEVIDQCKLVYKDIYIPRNPN